MTLKSERQRSQEVCVPLPLAYIAFWVQRQTQEDLGACTLPITNTPTHQIVLLDSGGPGNCTSCVLYLKSLGSSPHRETELTTNSLT